MSDFLNNIYYIDKGQYKDYFIVLLNITKNNFVEALILPDLNPQVIPVKDVELGIKTGVLLYVETLPKKIIKTCKKEYLFRLKKENS